VHAVHDDTACSGREEQRIYGIIRKKKQAIRRKLIVIRAQLTLSSPKNGEQQNLKKT
jgi:hypothetical protein